MFWNTVGHEAAAPARDLAGAAACRAFSDSPYGEPSLKAGGWTRIRGCMISATVPTVRRWGGGCRLTRWDLGRGMRITIGMWAMGRAMDWIRPVCVPRQLRPVPALLRLRGRQEELLSVKSFHTLTVN